MRRRVTCPPVDLPQVKAARWALTAAEMDLRAAVEQAHEAGASWQALGEALGVSKQTAWQRYGRWQARELVP